MSDFTPEEVDKIKESVFLITGGCGYIGCHLAQLLFAKKAKRVIVVDNLESDPNLKRRIQHLLPKDKFDFFNFDIDDISQLEEIIDNEDVNYIIHLANNVGVHESIDDATSTLGDLEKFVKLMSVAREYNIKFIYGSSSDVYDYNYSEGVPIKENHTCLPHSPFGALKLACENYARSYPGFESIGLRFFNVCGPDVKHQLLPGDVPEDMPFLPKMMKRAIKGKPIILENPDDVVDLISVLDCTIAVIKLILNDDPELWTINNVVNVGGNIAITMNDLADIVGGLAHNATGFEPQIDRRTGVKAKYTVGDIERLVTYSKYHPCVPPQVWLPEMMNHYFQIVQVKSAMKDKELPSGPGYELQPGLTTEEEFCANGEN